VSAGIGGLLGAAVRQSSTVTVVAITVSSYLFFLGGGLTTVAFLPSWLQIASHALPTSYAIAAIRQALFYSDLRGVGTDLLALCGFAVVSCGAGFVALRPSSR